MINRDFCNSEFLLEVLERLDNNALILLDDGSLAFGWIGEADDCVLKVFPPINTAEITQAVYRPAPAAPNAKDILANKVLLECEDIAQVIFGPFPALPFALSDAPVTRNVYPARSKDFSTESSNDLEELAEAVEVLEGRNIGIETLGSWRTGGRLLEIHDCSILLTVGSETIAPLIVSGTITVFGLALPAKGIVLSGEYHNVINIGALTGVVNP